MGQEIDKRIVNLVEALNLFGITNASCGGHLDPYRHQHPWINFNPGEIYPCRLQKVVREFNQGRPIQWEITEVPGGFTTIQPSTYKGKFRCCGGKLTEHFDPNSTPDISLKELETLQYSAEELALFLWSRTSY